MNGGPPNKWTFFPSQGMTSTQFQQALNEVAKVGYTGAAIEKECTDGLFTFVGGYGEQK